MNINGISGGNPYANLQQTAPLPRKEELIAQQNKEAAQTDLDQQSVDLAKEAFQVDITQEAREILATEETDQEPREAPANGQPPPRENSQEAARVVNIIA